VGDWLDLGGGGKAVLLEVITVLGCVVSHCGGWYEPENAQMVEILWE